MKIIAGWHTCEGVRGATPTNLALIICAEVRARPLHDRMHPILEFTPRAHVETHLPTLRAGGAIGEVAFTVPCEAYTHLQGSKNDHSIDAWYSSDGGGMVESDGE